MDRYFGTLFDPDAIVVVVVVVEAIFEVFVLELLFRHWPTGRSQRIYCVLIAAATALSFLSLVCQISSHFIILVNY